MKRLRNWDELFIVSNCYRGTANQALGLMRNGNWQYKVNLILSRLVRHTSRCTSVLARTFNSHGTQLIELDLCVN